MNKINISTSPTSSTASDFRYAGFGATGTGDVENQTTAPRVSAAPPKKGDKNIEKAVYGYIRALRALGKTRVTTGEVAHALGISTHDVVAALASLKEKGVKVAA